jgi:heat-inducible transcriptional repressor
VPTDSGYRCYVDLLMARGAAGRAGVELELSRLRREIDEAMRETTAALAQVTDLVALATAPAESRATIHRVEVLRLRRPGDGDRDRLHRRRRQDGLRLRAPVDPGLVEWASSYLNESLSGSSVGARMIADRLADPGLGRPRRGSSHARRGLHRARAASETSTWTAPRGCSPKHHARTCRGRTS